MKVGEDEEMRPRMRVASVPPAFRAADAEALRGMGTESFAAAYHAHAFSSLTGAVGETQLPASVVLES